MKHTMTVFVLMAAFFSVSFAKIPELHDTTIAVSPNTNPGDSLRLRKISYDGDVEKLVCYAIGKTVFRLQNRSEAIPEFDSASILVSNKLENLHDNNYDIMMKYFPSSISADTGNIIQTNAGEIETYYYQKGNLAIIFSFSNKKAGQRHEDLTTQPILFVYDVFDKLGTSTPHITTGTISKNIAVASKQFAPVSRRYLLNGRAIHVSSMNQNVQLIPNRIISKGF